MTLIEDAHSLHDDLDGLHRDMHADPEGLDPPRPRRRLLDALARQSVETIFGVPSYQFDDATDVLCAAPR